MNKRASFLDKLYVLYVFVAALIIIAVIGFAWSITQPILLSLGNNKTVELMNLLEPSNVNNWFDIIIVCAYFGLNILVCIGLPLYVENNPLFFGVLFVTMFFMILVIAVLANSLIDFMDGFQPTYTYTLFLLNHFVFIEVLFMLIMIFMLFFKSQKQEEIYY